MNYPIQHLSFSSLKNYLSNQAGWYRSYVLNERTNELSPAALVGRTIHKWAELSYRKMKDNNIHELVEQFFAEQSPLVDEWGKTGSPEKSKEKVLSAVRDLKRAIKKGKLPGPRAKIVNVEEAMLADAGFAVPLKALPDLIIRKKDGLHIFDWKSCSAFNKGPTPLYFMQTVFNARLAEKQYGEPIVDMTFVEIKPHKEEGPLKETINLVKLQIDWSALEFRAVDRLIKHMLDDIGGIKRSYLPNVMDMFSAEESWIAWLEETSDDPAYFL